MATKPASRQTNNITVKQQIIGRFNRLSMLFNDIVQYNIINLALSTISKICLIANIFKKEKL